jgi:hypothetical protein
MLLLSRSCSQPFDSFQSYIRLLLFLVSVAAGVVGARFQFPYASAQEAPFNPRFDATSPESQNRNETRDDEDEEQDEDEEEGEELPKPTATPGEATEQKIFSFARFTSIFKDLCNSLRVDGREARLFEVSEKGLADRSSCGGCRALYRQVVFWCRPQESQQAVARKKNPTPTPTATVTPTATASDEEDSQDVAGEEGIETEEKGGEEDAGESSEDADAVEIEPTKAPPTATPSPSPTPQPARYPSTEVIDAVSRLSAGLYELEPGFGATFEAARTLSQQLLSQDELTAAERDYYALFSSYLLSAWEGRPDSPLDPRVQAREDVSELFQ